MSERKIGIQILEGFILAMGVVSAIVATPFLQAAGQNLGDKHPAEPKSPAASQTAEPARTEKVSLDVKGLKSREDSEKIKGGLKQNPGVLSVACTEKSGVCDVTIDPDKLKIEDVAVSINKLGYQSFLLKTKRSIVTAPQ